MHKSQIFGYLLISFLVGIGAASYISDPTLVTLGLIVLATIVLVVSMYHRTFAHTKQVERNRMIGIVIGACIFSLAGGMLRYANSAFNHSVLATFADHELKTQGITVQLQGYVADEPTISTGKTQLVFLATRLSVESHVLTLHERTLVTTSVTGYRIGDLLKIEGGVTLPKNSITSGFDYVQYLKNKDIGTTMLYPKITPDSTVPILRGDQIVITLYRRLYAIKNNFQEAINTTLPQPYAAYINGVLLGSRQNIPQDLVDAFNKTSTTHILAISGYNITIIAEALLAVLIFFTRRRVAFWISVFVIILFTLMTGASASIVRAAIMGLLLLVAHGYGRWYNPKNSILLAAAVMVFFNPSLLRFDVGFQLSFLAVIGLVALYPVLQQRTKRWPKWYGIIDTLLMTFSAQVMVAPLLAYYFHQFSLVSLPANLLVLPLMPYTMLSGFLTGLAGLIFQPLARLIGFIAFAFSVYQIDVIKWFGGLPFSSVNVTIYWITLIVIYTLILTGIWRLRRRYL